MTLSVDPALVDAAKTDDACLERLVASVWSEAFRVAAAIVRDAALAEDVAQEACATMARSLRALKDSRTFAAWFYRIVSNRAVSAVRTRRPTVPIENAQLPAAHFDSSDALDL